MRSALLLLLAACGGLPRPFEVRLAREGEIPDRPHDLFDPPATRCKLEGADAPELRASVIAFARTNLIKNLDHLTGYPSAEMGIETPATSVGCDHPDHRDGYFTEITVQPRGKVGELIIAQRELLEGKCAWGADITYCLHVTQTPHGTTIVVEDIGGMIGTSEPVPAAVQLAQTR